MPDSSRTISSYLRVWWRLTRPHTLTASVIPVMVGTALAVDAQRLVLWRLAFMLLASLLLQVGTNMVNEYYDFRRGLDTIESVGIGGAIVRDGVAAIAVLRGAFIAFALALGLGIVLAAATSWLVLGIGLVGMAAGFFYTGGPRPIAWTPFGELCSGVLMGGTLVVLAYYVQTLQVNGASLALSIPTVLLVGSILLANNIRDLEGDRAHGRRTLPIVLGRRRATAILAGALGVAYAWLFVLALWVLKSPWVLIGLGSMYFAIRALAGFRRDLHASATTLMPAMRATAQTNTYYGLSLTLGMLLTHWIP